MLVDLLTGDAGLDHAIEILGVDRQHFVHVAEIDRDAAEGRVHMTFERGAGAERNHRHAAGGAEPHHLGNFGLGLGEQHGVGRLALEPSQRVGVLLTQRLTEREAVAEARGKLGEERPFALRGEAALTVGHDCGHGPTYKVLRRD
jgi:hypothetical protein